MREVDPAVADWIVLPVQQKDRSDMATQILAAGDELGLERYQLRTVSEGFRVPRAVAAHLFPSLFPNDSREG